MLEAIVALLPSVALLAFSAALIDEGVNERSLFWLILGAIGPVLVGIIWYLAGQQDKKAGPVKWWSLPSQLTEQSDLFLLAVAATGAGVLGAWAGYELGFGSTVLCGVLAVSGLVVYLICESRFKATDRLSAT